jgi:hypothetical protein
VEQVGVGADLLLEVADEDGGPFIRVSGNAPEVLPNHGLHPTA